MWIRTELELCKGEAMVDLLLRGNQKIDHIRPQKIILSILSQEVFSSG